MDAAGQTITGARFRDIHNIAVVRGGGLGDLILVEPAVRALAAAYPQARIRLLGSPVHARLWADRPGPVTAVDVLPVHRGLREGPADPSGYVDFLRRMRRIGLDLAVQLHGGGRNSNPFLLQLGARHTVGMATPQAPRLERTLAYVVHQHEVHRSLEVVALAGAVPVSYEPVVQVTAGEVAGGAGLLPPGSGPVLAMHTGATDPRRRWPADRFAEVARHALRAGSRVVLVGDSSDQDLALSVVEGAQRGLSARARSRIVSTAGRLSLSDLVSVLLQSDVLLANDSGPRHLAQAIGVPTVGLYWVGNFITAGPLTRARHRVQVAWATRCPGCGREGSTVRMPDCPHEGSLLGEIAVTPVLADVRALMATTRPPRER